MTSAWESVKGENLFKCFYTYLQNTFVNMLESLCKYTNNGHLYREKKHEFIFIYLFINLYFYL